MHTLTSLLLLAALLGALPAQAVSLNANVTADDFDGLCDTHCSLRDAVEIANQTPGADVIVLATGVYQLSLPAPVDAQGIPYDEDENLNGDLDIHDELVIHGRGDQLSRILGPGNDRLLEVRADVSLKLLRLSLERGFTAYTGGGVENHGDLLLRQVLVKGNRAITQNPDRVMRPPEEAYLYGQGGGIANYGTLQVYSSTLLENRAEGFFWDMNLGRGGAIFNRGGNLLVRDTTFRGNFADDQGDTGKGGGLYNSGSADISRSLFVRNSIAEQGYGGALINEAGGWLKLTNSTLSTNTGGLFNGDRDAVPGASPVATLINVTVANGAGYGVMNYGDLRVRNSLFAGNLDPYNTDGPPVNCLNAGPNHSYQAIGLLMNSGPSTCSADLYVDPTQTFTHLLYPLADHGGPTLIHALRKGSLAVDSGIGSCTSHDQRGLTRPRDGDGDGVAICDLGAYERAKP